MERHLQHRGNRHLRHDLPMHLPGQEYLKPMLPIILQDPPIGQTQEALLKPHRPRLVDRQLQAQPPITRDLQQVPLNLLSQLSLLTLQEALGNPRPPPTPQQTPSVLLPDHQHPQARL